ncbi:putative peptidoglycan glycosyltransferase FtsW [invertebrate metagenome]|uniref:peptidoglycan glycosyltransferase n=1 Tax=invertebrate metagenome TaxID=1711999 RepID=A0A2H9TAU6_9ZZZZ
MNARLQAFFARGEHKPVTDQVLLAVVLVLLTIGLLMVASASTDVANSMLGSPLAMFFKQLVYVCMGLGCLFLMLHVPVEKLEQGSWLLLLLAIVLLVAVLVVGREINGSVRWIHLGFFNLQASEAAKLCVIIYMAAYLVRRLEEVRTQWIGFIKPMAVLSFTAFLLLLEPDFGSLVILMGAAVGMIFMAGARLLPFAVLILVMTLIVVLLVLIEPYRMARLTSYMDPWSNAFGSGYQLTQSLIAFGRGDFLGEGLGNSIQKLFYLPESHTDFVYAVLAEEFGAVGSIIVLFLFLLVGWRALAIGSRAEKVGLLFHGFVAYGIAILFVSQSFINLGVSTGLLPTKGIALPLVSYGGSSLLINCIAMGILLRVDFERQVMKKTAVAGQRRHYGK